jgi:hypothetical protein
MIEIVKIAMDQEDPWIDTTFVLFAHNTNATSHHITLLTILVRLWYLATFYGCQRLRKKVKAVEPFNIHREL